MSVYPPGQARYARPNAPDGNSPYHPRSLGKSGEWGFIASLTNPWSGLAPHQNLLGRLGRLGLLGSRLWLLYGHGRSLGYARALLSPRLPEGPFIPRCGAMLPLPGQHSLGTYIPYERFWGGSFLSPPPLVLYPPIEGARTGALLHIGRGPLCAYL